MSILIFMKWEWGYYLDTVKYITFDFKKVVLKENKILAIKTLNNTIIPFHKWFGVTTSDY